MYLLIEIVECLPEATDAAVITRFFINAKLTVRAKGAGVNSVFLVQLRKKSAPAFRRLAGLPQTLERSHSSAGWAAVFVCRGWREENLLEWAAGLSTGRAQEMQKDSSQFSVVRLLYAKG